MATKVDISQHYRKEKTGLYECLVVTGGVKCTTKMKECTNICKHVKRHFPELKEQEGQLHFIMVNEKIEEVAARKHGMKKEDVAIAKAAAKNNLPLFCIPGCVETHNSGKLPYYPMIHLCQAPELPRGFKVQADKLKKPKIDAKLSSAK